MPNTQNARRSIERVAGRGQLGKLAKWTAVGHHGIGHKIETKNVSRRVKSGIGHRSSAVRNLCDRRKRTQQVRFVARRPFRNSPERVHHAARTVRKLIGEPPLIGEWRVRVSRQSLKISDPIVRTIGRFLVGGVAGLRVVKRFYCRKPRRVAVATLIRKIAAK